MQKLDFREFVSSPKGTFFEPVQNVSLRYATAMPIVRIRDLCLFLALLVVFLDAAVRLLHTPHLAATGVNPRPALIRFRHHLACFGWHLFFVLPLEAHKLIWRKTKKTKNPDL